MLTSVPMRIPIRILLLVLAGLTLAAAPLPAAPIDCSGTVEFRTLQLGFRQPGRVETLQFEEGSAVTRGTVLARLDDRELTIRRDATRMALEVAKARIPILEVAVRFQEKQAEAQQALARADHNAAVARLDEALAGTRTQQVEQAQAALDQAAIEEQRLEREVKRYREMRRAGAVNAQELDAMESRWKAAVQARRAAREQLDLLREGTRRETVAALQAGVARAEAGIAVAESLHLQTERARQELAALSREVSLREAELDLAEEYLSQTVVTAPMDGIILERIAETAEVLAAGSPLGILADLRHAWVRAYIAETDLGRVKPGMKAEVRTDSFPNRPLPGTVAFISPEAEFTPKNIQLKKERVQLVYRVRVDIDNREGILKMGMPVDVRLITE